MQQSALCLFAIAASAALAQDRQLTGPREVGKRGLGQYCTVCLRTLAKPLAPEVFAQLCVHCKCNSGLLSLINNITRAYPRLSHPKTNKGLSLETGYQSAVV